MRNFFLLLSIILTVQIATAQSVGIGTTTPNAKAALEINSTTKGLLIPSMTTSQRSAITVSTPAPNGLLVFDTDRGEFYQCKGSTWTPILNGSYWLRPNASKNRIANANDSVGIGTLIPTEWLDVDGNIRTRNNLIVDNNIDATGTVQGGQLVTAGNATVVGNSLFNGNVTTNSDLTINNTGATIQLKSSNENKGFYQLSGDNVRFGTNGGNTGGNVILRMDGDDVISYEKTANGILMRLNNGAGTSSGVLQTVTSGNRFAITNPIANGTVELGGEIFINNTQNRTGIGTSLPTERLQVEGNAFVTGNSRTRGNGYFGGQLEIQDTVWARESVITGYVGALSAGFGRSALPYDGTLAVGYDVLTNADGACIIADGTTGFLSNGVQNRMLMRFNQGYRFLTDKDLSTGAYMYHGDNSWSSVSDSTKKENFRYADGNAFLQKIAGMKLGSWNYKKQDKKLFRHYGPMAQEFHANFGNDGIGKIGNDTTIASADIDGVMMIAIQALVKEKELMQAEINNLKEGEKKLIARLAKLEAILYASKFP